MKVLSWLLCLASLLVSSSAWAQDSSGFQNGHMPFQWLQTPGFWYQSFLAQDAGFSKLEVLTTHNGQSTSLRVEIRSFDLLQTLACGRVEPGEPSVGWRPVQWENPIELEPFETYVLVVGSSAIGTSWRIGYSPKSVYPWGEVPTYTYTPKKQGSRSPNGSYSYTLEQHYASGGGGDLGLRAVYSNGQVWHADLNQDHAAQIAEIPPFVIPKCKNRSCNTEPHEELKQQVKVCGQGRYTYTGTAEGPSCDSVCSSLGHATCNRATGADGRSPLTCSAPFRGVYSTLCERPVTRGSVCMCADAPEPKSPIQDRWVKIGNQVALPAHLPLQGETCAEVCTAFGGPPNHYSSATAMTSVCSCGARARPVGNTNARYMVRQDGTQAQILDLADASIKTITVKGAKRGWRGHGNWFLEGYEAKVQLNARTGKVYNRQIAGCRSQVLSQGDSLWLYCIDDDLLTLLEVTSGRKWKAPYLPDLQRNGAPIITKKTVYFFGNTQRYRWKIGEKSWTPDGPSIRPRDVFGAPEGIAFLKQLEPGSIDGLTANHYAHGRRYVELSSKKIYTMPLVHPMFAATYERLGGYLRDTQGVYRMAPVPENAVWLGRRAYFGGVCPKSFQCTPVAKPFDDLKFIDFDPDKLPMDWWLAPIPIEANDPSPLAPVKPTFDERDPFSSF